MMRFAGFIMTYERSEILLTTIEKVFSQTFSPEKLLIIDNSETDATKLIVEKLIGKPIQYYKVGYNAGPAGAAEIGLRLLAQEGYQWIYWGDDNDPPHFSDTFELLLKHIHIPKIGVVGVSGNRFSRISGQLLRVPQFEIDDALIQQRKWIEVDAIAGNQSMIVNAAVVKKGILTDARLFFGFEELDFCLRVKEAGFNILSSTELFVRSREKFNRIKVPQSLYIFVPYHKLQRQYYGIRNEIIILTKHRLYFALLLKTIKSLIKVVIGFGLGFNYGKVSAQIILLALFDGWTRSMKTRKLPGVWG